MSSRRRRGSVPPSLQIVFGITQFFLRSPGVFRYLAMVGISGSTLYAKLFRVYGAYAICDMLSGSFFVLCHSRPGAALRLLVLLQLTRSLLPLPNLGWMKLTIAANDCNSTTLEFDSHVIAGVNLLDYLT